MEYRPRRPVTLPSLDAAMSLPLPDRMRKLFSGTDRVAEFLQTTLPGPLRYAQEVAPDIAYSIDDIDGPFTAAGFGVSISQTISDGGGGRMGVVARKPAAGDELGLRRS